MIHPGKRHRKNGNHGKRGWVSGNPRYRRNRRKEDRKDRTMCGLREQR
jgi:hypothetical protein